VNINGKEAKVDVSNNRVVIDFVDSVLVDTWNAHKVARVKIGTKSAVGKPVHEWNVQVYLEGTKETYQMDNESDCRALHYAFTIAMRA
jgi:hypothetical protein